MKELKERIANAIDKKAMENGLMGNETVSISLELTNEEMVEFKEIDLDEHYNYDIEGNRVDINYTEDL